MGPLEVMVIFVLLIWPGTIIWVAIDASKRTWPSGTLFKSAGGWCVGLILLWIVVFPVYLVQRGRAPVGVYGAPVPQTPPPPPPPPPLD